MLNSDVSWYQTVCILDLIGARMTVTVVAAVAVIHAKLQSDCHQQQINSQSVKLCIEHCPKLMWQQVKNTTEQIHYC